MKTLFISVATANRTLMALIYIPLKSNLYQDVCLFFLRTFRVSSADGFSIDSIKILPYGKALRQALDTCKQKRNSRGQFTHIHGINKASPFNNDAIMNDNFT